MKKFVPKIMCMIILPLFLGTILSLCLAPFKIIFIGFFSFSYLIYLRFKYAKTSWQNFLIGISFGYGYFCTSLYWLFYAFLNNYDNSLNFILYCFLSVALIGVFFAILSLYWGFGFLLANYSSKILPYNISLALSFFIIEFLRANLFTGFPWNLLSFCAMPNLFFMHSQAVIGYYNYVFFTALIFSSPAIFFTKQKQPILQILLVLFSLLLIFVSANIYNSKTEPTKTLRLGLVQTNLSQKDKMNPILHKKNFFDLINLIKKNNNKDIDLIICPETSIGFLLDKDKLLEEIPIKILQSILYEQQKLLIGAVLKDKSNFYNVAILLDKNKILDISAKHHLVPFGEYLPFKSLLHKILPNLNAIAASFSPGQNHHIVNINNSKFLPLICYEAIFYNEMNTKTNYDFVLNIVNDGWYNNSIGITQHFTQALINAINHHKKLVRIDNKGITAVTDTVGRISYKNLPSKTHFETFTLR